MKVFLDEGVPENLAKYLPTHDVVSVRQLGLKGTKNGKLLDKVARRRFQVFITSDKKMEAEQHLLQCPFAIHVLSACNLPVILPHIEAITSAVHDAVPGTVIAVECGRFRPRKRSF